MKKINLFYVGLEKLKSRYTYQLTDWNVREFERDKKVNRNFSYTIVDADLIDTSTDITLGQVLDAYGRPYYALGQIQTLIRLLKNKSIDKDSVIFFEDMFHPGVESLFYILSFLKKEERPRIVMRCLAQTIDPNDFVHQVGMFDWMRKYEEMVNNFVDYLCIASTDMALHFQIAGWKIPVVVTGLPFGKQEVIERASYKKETSEFTTRPLKVCFAARTDREKQPDFFVQVARETRKLFQGQRIEFAILSGKRLASNDPEILTCLETARQDGEITIYEDLSKEDYYAHLKSSRVLFNCALQDWVSNTASEADALGCNLVYPAYRSFPELFLHEHTRMYVPWSVKDAALKVSRALCVPHPHIGLISDNMDSTIDKTLSSFYDFYESEKFVPSDASNFHAESIRKTNAQSRELSRNLSSYFFKTKQQENFWNFSYPPFSAATPIYKRTKSA